MTYVEFFDRTSIENICACLTDAPERVIFLGDNAKLMKRYIENYKKVFLGRGQDIEFVFRRVSKGDLGHLVDVLEDIINEYEECSFGITGGEEMLMLALGIVYERYSDKNIQIHKFGIRNNRIYDCDKDGNTIYKGTPVLSVEENVRIYGGDIVYGDSSGDKTYLWNMTADFVKDIDAMWVICRNDVRAWNTQIAMFENLDKLGTVSEDGLTVTVQNVRHKPPHRIIRGIINQLRHKGLLTEYEENEEQFTLSYKNAQVKKCLTKAGMVLEMKVYASARSLRDSDGTPIYNDAMNGVVIDWDGELHEVKENFHDTKNEIDVLLMHGMIPIFISCKNGDVTVNELYKLNTVAERFGGKYAKKVLVATALDSLGETGKYIRQRAQDMNIRVVENLGEKELKNSISFDKI